MAWQSAAEQPNLNRTPINPNTHAAEQWHMLTVHGTVVDVKSTFPVGTEGQTGCNLPDFWSIASTLYLSSGREIQNSRFNLI
jgi:hypothetical protein